MNQRKKGTPRDPHQDQLNTSQDPMTTILPQRYPYHHQWVPIQEGTKAMEVEGLGVLVGVGGQQNAMTFIPGAALNGNQIVPLSLKKHPEPETRPKHPHAEHVLNEDDPFYIA